MSTAVDQDAELRRANSGDLPQIVELVESAYRGDSSRIGWTTEADLLGGQRTDIDEVEEIVTDPDSRLLVLVRHGRIIGCVLVRREPTTAYIGMLAVRPELQSKGVGRLLLAEAERHALAEFGCGRARMTVIEQRSELIAWYERRGYENTSRIEPFPYGEPRFGLPKRDDLRFVVLEKSLT
jgi:ribosomal protein S18 acetylase RimI-like enzyme